MSRWVDVALLGFSGIERGAIAGAFRAAAALDDGRGDVLRVTPAIDDAQWLLVDAQEEPAVRVVLITERLADSVFVGAGAPPGAAACVPRPVDPQHLLRELQALVMARRLPALAASGPAAPAGFEDSSGFGLGFDPAFPAKPTQARVDGLQPWPAAAKAPHALVVHTAGPVTHALTLPLQRWGLVVETATSSGQAAARLSRFRFDCVFLALTLGPHSTFDGLVMCQQLKRQPHAPHGAAPWVALLAPQDSQADRVRGALAGCDAFLTPPMGEEELAGLLWRQGWAPRPPRRQSQAQSEGARPASGGLAGRAEA